MDESLINHAAKCEKESGGNFAVVIRTKVCLCEKEPISDYPVSQFITGECTKISYTLANLLPSHNSSYYVDDIDRAKYRPIDGQLIEIVGRQLSIEKFAGFTGHGVLFSAFG